MSRTARPRSVRFTVVAGAAALAATALYTATQHADASEVPAPPVKAAASPVGRQAAVPTTPPPTTPALEPKPEGARHASASAPTRAETEEPANRSPLSASRVAASQLPDTAAQKWKELAPASVRKLSQDFQLNECVSVHGATAWQQQGFISAHRTPAVQDSLAFDDEATARSAFRELLADMKSCQATSRALQKQYGLPQDAEVRQTAATSGGVAWSRSWTAVEGLSASGAQANHIYAVRRGSLLVLLHFDEWDAVAPRSYDTAGDAAVLAGLTR